MRKFLMTAALAVVGLFSTTSTSQAGYVIRATVLDSGNNVIGFTTSTTFGTAGTAYYGLAALNTATVANPAAGIQALAGGFTITATTNISSLSPGTTSVSATINFSYSGPTGASSQKLIIEVLGDGFTVPSGVSSISSNGSPSNNGTLNSAANSISMTSGVILGNAVLSNALLGTLGTTVGTGQFVAGSSTVLSPNPATGVANLSSTPFSFYQVYQFGGFANSGASSLSAGSIVTNVPAPAGLVLALAGMPVFGLGAYIRRRREAKAQA